MHFNGYSDLKCLVPKFIQSPLDVEKRKSRIWVASFKLDQDVQQLFPYINAAWDEAAYYETPQHLRLLLNGYRCILYPTVAVAYYFEGKAEVKVFIDQVIVFLNDIYSRQDQLVPNRDKIQNVPIIDVLKVLPKTNCRECGYLSCIAFAAALSKGKVTTDKCPTLSTPIHENAVYPIYNNEGQVISSLSLRIDTSRLKSTIHEQQEKIAMLEASLKSFAQNQSEPTDLKASSTNVYGLTEREIEVLKLIAQGYTNNEISGSLFISSHTVKSHMINIFNKLNVNDRTKAAVLATKAQLI